MNGFLPQTPIVENLLQQVLKLLNELPDSREKLSVFKALKPFREATVPSALFLEEVIKRLKQTENEFYSFITHENLFALSRRLLLDAAEDVDLN